MLKLQKAEYMNIGYQLGNPNLNDYFYIIIFITFNWSLFCLHVLYKKHFNLIFVQLFSNQGRVTISNPYF